VSSELDAKLDALTRSERRRLGNELCELAERFVELLKPRLGLAVLEMVHEIQLAAGRESRVLVALERDEHPGVWLGDLPAGDDGG
jgi:hypothetical protein